MTTLAKEKLLTPDQVAARLQISKATVYRMIAAGTLPALQLNGPGSTLRVSERELAEWLFSDRPDAA
jgi:excisionase family DNA binding protein